MAYTTTPDVSASVITQWTNEVYQQGAAYLHTDPLAFEMGGSLGSTTISEYDDMDIVTTALAEDTDDTAFTMNDTPIVVDPTEHGRHIVNVLKAQLRTGGKVDLAQAQVLGRSMGRTLNRLAIIALDQAVNVDDQSGVAFSGAMLKAMRTDLEADEVPTFSNGLYACVIHPNVLEAIRDDIDEINKYGLPNEALRSVAGVYKGFMLISEAQVTSLTGVYNTYAFGADGLIKKTDVAPGLRVGVVNDAYDRFYSLAWYAQRAYKIKGSNSVILNQSLVA